MPASPASKPASKMNQLTIDTSVRQVPSVIMSEDERVSPHTAGPRLNSPGTGTLSGGFGIKLQKVQNEPEPAASVPKPAAPANPPVEEEKKEGDGDSDGSDKDDSKLPEPLPLLPKVTNTFSVPPKCPIDSIRFI